MPGEANSQPLSAMKVFLFTDLVDSTAWKKKLGDREYAAGLRQPHDRLFRELLASFPGAIERDNAGDGFLATFASPSDAVLFALGFHKALADFDWSAAIRPLPLTRIGIHLGEVVEYEDAAGMKVAGQAVDLAARVMGLGIGGQTLLTRHAFDSARQHVRDETLSWPAHGQYRFKGSDDPLEIFEVGVVGTSPLVPPPDGEKARRVTVDPEDDTGSWRPAAGLIIPRRDGWRLESQLGEGGFGEVWLARHARTKEARVFKFCFDAERLRSFKRELTFFRLIQSELGTRPDFVRLFDVQVEKPPYFLESEFVEAGNLAQWLERRGGFDGWPLANRLKFLAGVARAVAAAHSLGIIHKDLKPSNVLVKVDEQGEPQPMLADFGIGVLSDRSRLAQGNITETGFTESIMLGNDSSRTGTRLYSPPEAQVGKPATTGTDVYALGVMLFQFAVGDTHRPLGTGWAEAIANDDPHRAALLVEDVTAATFFDPVRRLSAAAELADRLDRLEDRISERQEAANRVLSQQRRKRRRWQMAVGSAAMVLAFGVMVFALCQERKRADLIAANANEREEESNRKIQAEIEYLNSLKEEARKQRQLLDVMRIREAGGLIEKDSYGLAREMLDQVEPGNESNRGNRSSAWHLIRQQAESSDWTLHGSTGNVWSVAWSPDGRSIASVSERTVYLWNVATRTCIRELKGHDGFITNISWSPNGRTLASGGNNIVRIWDANTGECLKDLKGHAYSASITWSPDSRKIACSGSVIYSVRIWEVASGAYVDMMGNVNSVDSVSWSPDGQTIASGGADNTLRLWDTTTGQCIKELKGHTQSCKCVSWNPNGLTLASGSEDKTVLLWNASTGTCIQVFRGHTSTVTCVSWSPDGRTLASGSYDDSVRIWDTAAGSCIREIRSHANSVLSLCWSIDGRILAAGCSDNSVRLWNMTKELSVCELKGHDNSGKCLSWSPNGRWLATTDLDETVRVWDVITGTGVKELTGQKNRLHENVSWSPDSRMIALSGWDNTLLVWDTFKGGYVKEFSGNIDPYSGVYWSPDGRTLAIGCHDNSIRFWHAATGECVRQLKGHNNSVSSLAWSPDGRSIASGSLDTNVRIWDLATGICFKEFKGHSNSVVCISWSPDGQKLASGSYDNTVRIWDMDSGTCDKEFKGHTDPVTSVSWSPDGRTLASGSLDNFVRLWDLPTQSCVAEIKGHTDPVSNVSWNPDGRILASGSEDKTIRLWHSWRDPSHPEELARLKRMIDPNPNWHREQAAECEKQSNWFAAAFHLRRLAALEPADAAVKARLAAAEKKLKPREVAPLPKPAP